MQQAQRVLIAAVVLGLLIPAAAQPGAEPPEEDEPPVVEQVDVVALSGRDFAAEWHALVRRAQGIERDEQDGAGVLERVLGAMERVLDESEPVAVPRDEVPPPRFDFSLLVEFQPHEDAVGEAERVLAAMAQAGVFAGLDELREYPGAGRAKPDGPLMSVQRPDIGSARRLARMQEYRLRAAAEARRWDEAAAVVEQTLTVAAIFLRRPSTIEQFVGMAVAQSMLREIGRGVAGRIADEGACRRMLEAVERLPRVDLAVALEGDRLTGLESIWRLAPAEGNEEVASREEESAKLDEFYDRAVRVAAMPAREWAEPSLRLTRWAADLPPRFRVSSLVSATLARGMIARDQAHVLRDGVLTLLAVEVHRIRTGRPPHRLEDIVPDSIAALPPDPFSRERALFQFRRTDPATDPAGRAYIVYSVGWDQVDRGGRQHPRHNAAAAGEEGAGYDFIVNPAPEQDPGPGASPDFMGG